MHRDLILLPPLFYCGFCRITRLRKIQERNGKKRIIIIREIQAQTRKIFQLRKCFRDILCSFIPNLIVPFISKVKKHNQEKIFQIGNTKWYLRFRVRQARIGKRTIYSTIAIALYSPIVLLLFYHIIFICLFQNILIHGSLKNLIREVQIQLSEFLQASKRFPNMKSLFPTDQIVPFYVNKMNVVSKLKVDYESQNERTIPDPPVLPLLLLHFLL